MKKLKENWKMETAASFKKQFDGESRLECHERKRQMSKWVEREREGQIAHTTCVARLRTVVSWQRGCTTDRALRLTHTSLISILPS